MGKIRLNRYMCIDSQYSDCHGAYFHVSDVQSEDLVAATDEINRILSKLSEYHPHLAIVSSAKDLINKDLDAEDMGGEGLVLVDLMPGMVVPYTKG